ncbi:purine/pyrimidine permease [Halorarum halophilum]|uniref:Purine/pyrimidine permease n=1 Tax=Halorarum halophilum TaxID=2743090 RepID=A0A7D5KEF5_9EURY|nr:solute carrier family 23 protein [Halobaculum halophilum]QLG26776.1 purine/pyrimidine permease [Halobaculum halophilum]
MNGDESGGSGRESDRTSFVEYGIEDRPSLSASVVLGLQHYLTMVGANVAVPLILAGALGMPTGETARFVGTFFVVSGVATLAQTTFGNRYPIVQGAPFSMLAPAIAIVTVVGATAGEPLWQTRLQALQGAIIVAALVEIAIGYFGIVGKLRQYLSPVTIAPTIVLIGLALFDVPQVTAATNDWWLLGLTLLLVLAFSQYLDRRHWAFRLFPVILGVSIAWVVAAALSVAGVYGSGAPGYVALGTVADAPAVVPIYPLQWGMPTFQLSFAIGMFAGVLASIVESFGDYHAVARLVGSGAPSEERINHGIGMEGIMNVFSGIMGTGGSTSYSENIGAIGLTGVASRFVVQIGAVMMLVVGYVGYVGQLVATIPDPIVGGLFVVMFGQIVAVGLSNLTYVDLNSSRNVFIVGFALFVGLAIPEYMGAVGSAEAFQAGMATVPLLGPALGTSVFAGTMYVVGTTGMAVGGLAALVLDNTIPGTDEERGLTRWESLTESSDAFQPFWREWFGGDERTPDAER